MKGEKRALLWKDVDSKKCQICVVQMAKNLIHSFYYILYQPKGVPSSHCNFSGSGGTKMAAISILVNAVICQSQIG